MVTVNTMLVLTIIIMLLLLLLLVRVLVVLLLSMWPLPANIWPDCINRTGRGGRRGTSLCTPRIIGCSQ
jgi:hypothetical protein